jgi:hypothetical protein
MMPPLSFPKIPSVELRAAQTAGDRATSTQGQQAERDTVKAALAAEPYPVGPYASHAAETPFKFLTLDCTLRNEVVAKQENGRLTTTKAKDILKITLTGFGPGPRYLSAI